MKTTTQRDVPPDTLEDMLAKHQIREVLARYARAVDRADGPLLKTCYHPDAIEEHGGNYTGNAHQYVEQAIPRILKMGPMQHLLGNSYIQLEAERAEVETYVWTYVRFRKGETPYDTFTGGRLLDRFEARNGIWKIAHRRTVFDWNRDTPSAETWCLGMFTPGTSGMLQGCKGPQDPSFQAF